MLPGQLLDACIHLLDLLGRFTLGEQNQVRVVGHHKFQVPQPHRELIDPHHAFRPIKIHLTQGIAHQVTRFFFFVRGDGIFQIKDYGIGLVNPGVERQLGRVAGQIEPRAAVAVCRGSVLILQQHLRPKFHIRFNHLMNGRLDACCQYKINCAAIFDAQASVLDAETGQDVVR